VKAIVLDAKGDTPWMLKYRSVLSLNDLAFSLVACPSYAAPTAFINRWLMLFRECFWTAELQSAVLLPVLREVIQPGRPASVEDMVDRIRLRDRSPAGKAAADRLESTSLVYPNLYESRASRWDDLHETSLYCAIEGTLTPATRFVLWLVIIERFAFLQHQQHRDRVHTVVLLDEAQTSLSKRQQTISGLPSTPVQLLPTTREHGMQFVVATPSWTELDPLVLSQFQVQIALQPSDGRELDAITKSFRLTPAQSRFTCGMQRGTAIGKIRGIEHPFPSRTSHATSPRTSTSTHELWHEREPNASTRFRPTTWQQGRGSRAPGTRRRRQHPRQHPQRHTQSRRRCSTPRLRPTHGNRSFRLTPRVALRWCQNQRLRPTALTKQLRLTSSDHMSCSTSMQQRSSRTSPIIHTRFARRPTANATCSSPRETVHGHKLSA